MAKLIYVDHKGNKMILGNAGSILVDSDIRDYSWEYSQNGFANSSFSKTKATRKMTVRYKGNAAQEIDNFHDIIHRDIANNKKGKLYYLPAGGSTEDYMITSYWHIDCNIIGSKVDGFWEGHYYVVTYTVVADTTSWFYDFVITMPENDGERRYAINLDSVIPADCEITAYGNSQTNDSVEIVIGQNTYQVFEPLLDGEKIVINTKDKTVVKIDSSNNSTNLFSKRGKSSYIFSKLQPGRNSCCWGKYEIDILIYKERSEPPWQN